MRHGGRIDHRPLNAVTNVQAASDLRLSARREVLSPLAAFHYMAVARCVVHNTTSAKLFAACRFAN